MKIKLDVASIAIIILSIALVISIVFSRTNYKDKLVKNETKITQLEKEIEFKDKENRSLQEMIVILKDSADDQLVKIDSLIVLARSNVKEQIKEIDYVVDTMSRDAQQEYFDEKFPPYGDKEIMLDTVQANQVIKAVEERDVYFLAVLEAERINVEYQAYIIQAVRLVQLNEQLVVNLNENIANYQSIITEKDIIIDKTARQVKRERLKSKLILGVAIVTVGAILVTE